MSESGNMSAIIRSLRMERGWTQEELSSRSGISRARISDIENGKETFTLVSIMSLGEAFEIDYRELLKY